MLHPLVEKEATEPGSNRFAQGLFAELHKNYKNRHSGAHSRNFRTVSVGRLSAIAKRCCEAQIAVFVDQELGNFPRTYLLERLAVAIAQTTWQT